MHGSALSGPQIVRAAQGVRQHVAFPHKSGPPPANAATARQTMQPCRNLRTRGTILG